VVEDVEKIRSRLKGKPLVESELPPERQIDLRHAESAQGISSQMSLHRPGGNRECRWIDFPSAGYVRIGDPEWHSGNQIRTLRTVLSTAAFHRFWVIRDSGLPSQSTEQGSGRKKEAARQPLRSTGMRY
jgi:hypothetical protein